jgi:hypothetical protein
MHMVIYILELSITILCENFLLQSYSIVLLNSTCSVVI